MKVLDRLEEWIIGTLIALATLVVFMAVVHRYLSGLDVPVMQDFLIKLNSSWAQELCIIMFIWMAKFGAAYGVRTGIHVGVDVLINRLSERWRYGFIIFGLFAGAAFTGIIGSLGVYLISHTSIDQTTEVLEWPMRYVYLCIPLGSYLMCFRFLQVMVHFIREGELPKHDHAYVEGLDDEIAEAGQGAKS